jgi:hypothetical protein
MQEQLHKQNVIACSKMAPQTIYIFPLDWKKHFGVYINAIGEHTGHVL